MNQKHTYTNVLLSFHILPQYDPYLMIRKKVRGGGENNRKLFLDSLKWHNIHHRKFFLNF